MTQHPVIAALLAALLATLLAACGPAADLPQPTPTPMPQLRAEPTVKPVGPAPTIDVPELTLPGRLLFVKNGDIWMWQATAGRQLTMQGNLFQPTWSPDGAWIAATQRDESYSNIVVLTATGSEPLVLTNNGTTEPLHSYERIYDTAWALYPSFSPDSRSVIFSGQAAPPFGSPAIEYNLTLFRAPITAGGQEQQLYASEDGQVGRPIYAPDGKAIVFTFTPRALDAASQIVRFDPARGTVEALPGVPPQSYDPAFSADGRWLAFAARIGGRTDLFASPAAGGEPVQLTELGTARAPAWSPDGSMLAWLALAPGGQHFDLWVADVVADGGALRLDEPRQLTENLGVDADSGLAWGR